MIFWKSINLMVKLSKFPRFCLFIRIRDLNFVIPCSNLTTLRCFSFVPNSVVLSDTSLRMILSDRIFFLLRRMNMRNLKPLILDYQILSSLVSYFAYGCNLCGVYCVSTMNAKNHSHVFYVPRCDWWLVPWGSEFCDQIIIWWYLYLVLNNRLGSDVVNWD